MDVHCPSKDNSQYWTKYSVGADTWVLAWMVGLMEGWTMDAWIDVDICGLKF